MTDGDVDVFLKLMHDELLRFNLRDFDSDLLQCIHCRFHIMICVSPPRTFVL